MTTEYDFVITDIHYVLERKPNTSWQFNDHANSRYHILAFAKSGYADYTVEGRQYRISAGDVLFFPKGQVHTGISDQEEPWSFYTVPFDAIIDGAGVPYSFTWLGTVTSMTQRYEFATLFAGLHRAWIQKKPGYLVHCRGLLMNLLYLLIQEQVGLHHNSVHSLTIENIITHILEHPRDTFRVAELAHMANLSPSHFRMLFKEATGLSVVQYQNRLKINRARDLLLGGSCNVTEAADLVGIPDIYYFSRLFKKLTGVSPSEYKKL